MAHLKQTLIGLRAACGAIGKMAQYRLSITRASRKDGRSSVAMAAYRAGVEMEDRRTGQAFDYTRKGGIRHTEIVLPDGAPVWAKDRNELWNRSESADRRQDAQVAREVQLSLPHEMNDEQRREITLQYARYVSDRFGVAVDMAIHEPNRNGDERNHHAHLLLCTRPFDNESKTGFGNKNRELDMVAQLKRGQSTVAEEMRERWTSVLNAGLERGNIRTPEGVIVALDHRSYERQGVDLEPTVKMGVSASAIERKGGVSERGQLNREIIERNELRRRAGGEARRLTDNLSELIEFRDQPGKPGETWPQYQARYQTLVSRIAGNLSHDQITPLLANTGVPTETWAEYQARHQRETLAEPLQRDSPQPEL
jgi:hypothetical protein